MYKIFTSVGTCTKTSKYMECKMHMVNSNMEYLMLHMASELPLLFLKIRFKNCFYFNKGGK